MSQEEIFMKITALNGFKDILPEEIPLWQRIESKALEILRCYTFEELRLPILEKTALFARSIGETTDIVEKEMYTFVDKQITMRPEATASIVRAYLQHGLYVQKPVQRLFTLGPMFRHERPQKGRLRQFHQLSVEILGAESAMVDAELLALGGQIFATLGLDVSLEINSLGCPQCRPEFRSALIAFLETRKNELCEDCVRRFVVNPLRVLDCKNENCRALVADAPSILDWLCHDCEGHFAAVKESLASLGVSYVINTFMSAVCAGGRYDGLVEQLGGPATPGIGFAMGLERLVLLLEQQEQAPAKDGVDIFVVGLGEKAGHFAYVTA
ncbi:unnamed protein product, partial [Cyprideis torosa]